MQEAQEIAASLGLEIVTAAISELGDIQLALDTLLPRVDVIYTPTDNMVGSALPMIIARTLEHGIPVIGADTAHVEAGALATEGIDYFQLGFETGLQAAKVLRGAKPSEMGVNVLQETELVINLETATKLGIEIPSEFTAKFVGN